MIIKLPESVTEQTTRDLHENLFSILASKCLTVVFDFSRVREMDSAAMGALLRCMNQIVSHDGVVRVSGMSAEASIFLELTRMDSLFAMFKGAPAPTPAVAVPEFAKPVMRDRMQVTAA